MVPNNSEEQLKDRFSSRTITPSDNAWELLEQQLGQKKIKRFNFKYLYGAIAAVFIGVIVMISLINNKVDVHEEFPVVTTEPSGTDEIIIENSETEQLRKNHLNQAPVVVAKKENNASQPPALLKEKATQNSNAVVINDIKDFSENKKNEALEVTAIEDNKSKGDDLINTKVDEVLKSISELNAQNGEVTDAEINALLEKAQREINTQRVLLKNNKVDAIALLLDVEEEIDQSFRDKVFEAIKNGYSKVKIAVVEGNN